MANRRKARGKTHRQVVVDTVLQKALALPIEVVMVRNCRDCCLGNQLGQRQPQRQMHWNRQRVFDHQHVNRKLTDEGSDLLLEIMCELMYLAGELWRTNGT